MSEPIDMKGLAAGERLLDPFGSFPNMANRMAGLPGGIPSHEPGYVFHTLYVPVTEGRRTFTVRFAGLKATHGIISLRVHMIRADRGEAAKLIDSERLALDDLADNGGVARISFPGYQGMHFAFYGTIPGSTDAWAEDVTITVDGGEPDDDTGDRGEVSAMMPTMRRAGAITSSAPPTLGNCTSQGWTDEVPNQAFRRWADKLGLATLPTIESWRFVYPLLALEQFDMLHAGVRMLWIGEAPDRLREAIEERDVVISIVGTREEAEDHYFDVLCSVGMLDGFDAERAAYECVDAMLGSVAIGGLAIHIFNARAQHGGVIDGKLVMSTHDIERWGLNSLAFHQSVAEIKPPAQKRGADDFVRPFAFIQYRGR